MFNCNRSFRHPAFGLLLALMVSVMPAAGVAQDADPKAAGTADGQEQRIHITADRLVVETTANTAEFIGNVNASQEDTRITCDRLKIYYKEASGTEEEQTLPTQTAALKKLLADGNVIIRLDDKVAVTDQAVYLTDTEVLILTGPGSKITSNNNSVSGDKITLHRLDNRMEVDGSTDKRVEAILYTKDKGIQ
jgi:lipopolysaccharide export system protein LptA